MSIKQQLLREILQEDQEPFHLNNYNISDKRCQLKKTKPKKPNPIMIPFQASHFTCKDSCFSSLSPNSPNPTNINPNPNAIFLHIPLKTASLLQEAALRIQKQSCSEPWLARNKAKGFGSFGSLIKRLSLRNIKKYKLNVTTNIIQREEKDIIKEDYGKQFCESPFRFVLLRSPPSPARRTPVSSSTASSPSRGSTMDKEAIVETQLKFQVLAEKDEEARVVEEEDKEHCSPVSVLDPPLEDDDDGCDNQMEDDGFDIECTYSIVQRTKKQLLKRLRRFEKLAGLDPVELEKRMWNQDQAVENNDLGNKSDFSRSEEEVEFRKENLNLSNGDKNIDAFVMEEVGRSSFYKLKKMPIDVFDEEEWVKCGNGEVMAKRVCKRIELRKDVESNTFDMMMERHFTRENEEWKRFLEQVEEAAFQIELVILGWLIEELTEELVV